MPHIVIIAASYPGGTSYGHSIIHLTILLTVGQKSYAQFFVMFFKRLFKLV